METHNATEESKNRGGLNGVTADVHPSGDVLLAPQQAGGVHGFEHGHPLFRDVTAKSGDPSGPQFPVVIALLQIPRATS